MGYWILQPIIINVVIQENFVSVEEEIVGSTLQVALCSAVGPVDDMYSENKTGGICGLETGFPELDRLTSGLQAGDLIIVAGRPSIGKTAFSLNIAENVALNSNKPVAIFSMEMSGPKVAMRMLGSVGKIDQHKLHTGRFDDYDWSRLTNALCSINNAPIDIVDTLAVGWNVECLEKALLEREIKPSLIIVDGLQMFDVTNTATAYDRNIQLGEQVRQLKKMALTLNVPVILTASVNRELESRPNKRPIMKDLRDIGMLEDLADKILFIYRDEIYYPNSLGSGMAEIIIGKQRNGPSGMVSLNFSAEYTRFDNLGQG